MSKKKPLVENARSGLDALKTQLFQEIQQRPPSYRERFRTLARQRIGSREGNPNAADPKSPPNR